MITLGAACLYLALLVAVFGAVAALFGTRGDRRFTDSARRAVYAFAALLTSAWSSSRRRSPAPTSRFKVVADHSSTTTPASTS